MSPSLFLRTRTYLLLLVSFLLVVVVAASGWIPRPHASSSATAFVVDKAVVTPAGTVITVNSLSDAASGGDGFCTLREAITAANNNAASGAAAGECSAGSSGSDSINFSVTGTINLTSALPSLSSDMTITGPGSSQLTVQRSSGGLYRIFTISSGTISMSGLTVMNGQTAVNTPTASVADGGGIWNAGVLSLSDVTVTANATGVGSRGNGGGISNSGTLTMTNCLVSGNSTGSDNGTLTSGSGGGISSFGSLTMTNSKVTANTTGNVGAGGNSGSGGGILSNGSLNLNTVEVSSNIVGNVSGGGQGGGAGGGIAAGGPQAIVTNCTVKNNQAGSVAAGGGISATNMIIVGSTISGNTSQLEGAGIVTNLLVAINTTVSGNHGIGIATPSGKMALTNCTIVGNDAERCTATAPPNRRYEIVSSLSTALIRGKVSTLLPAPNSSPRVITLSEFQTAAVIFSLPETSSDLRTRH
jgi:CSLREA domain-containing protein